MSIFLILYILKNIQCACTSTNFVEDFVSQQNCAAASTSKSHTCIGRERSVPAKKNKRETKDGVERIRPKWLMPSFIVLQYI